jgi:two-component system, chemotaxis family, chemotaxis protein CheY
MMFPEELIVSKAVLVVDDSTSIRQMVAFTLQKAGFTVIEGAEGRDALARVQGHVVSLVITDLNMPVMDGMTLIRELRAKPEFKFTPILMLTTESQQGKKLEGKAAGATGWIVKPFEPEQLLQVVNKVVR